MNPTLLQRTNECITKRQELFITNSYTQFLEGRSNRQRLNLGSRSLDFVLIPVHVTKIPVKKFSLEMEV